MLRTLLVLSFVSSACESSSPCGDGQRLAQNDRGGVKIQYCVRKDDGRAQGRYTCALPNNRGTVIGTYDANFKHGEWHYSIGDTPIRTERWHNDVLEEVTVLADAPSDELECDGHVIAPHPKVPAAP